jgi:hypothetical protein
MRKLLLFVLPVPYAGPMACDEYDRLTKASSDAMDALQFGLQIRADPSWKSRVRSRLIVAEIAVNRHVTDCKTCQDLRRAPAEFNSNQLYL